MNYKNIQNFAKIGTNIGPETKLTVNGGTMKFKDAIAYELTRSQIHTNI